MSRKIDLSSFKGDSDDEDFMPRNKALKLNDLKSRTFSHGITKKSKRDLEREAEEKKKKEEDEAAAKALAEFEESFDGPSAGPSGGFGRGMGGGFVRAGGAPMPMNVQPQIPTGPAGPPRGPASMGYARPHRPVARAPSPPMGVSKPKGKRAMDSFLQEIKGNQAAREQRLGKTAQLEGSSVSALAAWENSSGRQSFNEQESTNLFVGNIPGSVTEDSLGRFFAEIGPVGSAKIMWPRSELEMENVRRGKQSLTGFVAYMKRKDAETAVSELDSVEWGGSKLKVGFSKPVPIPQRAIYDLGKGGSSSRKRSRSRSPDQRNRRRSRSRSPDDRRRGRSRSRDKSRSPPRKRRNDSHDSVSLRSRSPSPRPRKLTAREKWLAKIPEEQDKFIRAVVDRVKEYGRDFEDSLRERERDNPKFAFLRDDKIPDYHLYRSKLSSRYRIPTPPPEDFEDEGYASMYSSDSAEDSERERTEKGKIGRLAQKRFEAMLRVMSGKRAEIGRAMEFAMNKAEAADEVSELICQSLKLDSTPVPRKLARLHLISDILHNAASPLPNVWKYKFAFEKRLPDVFAHFKGVYDSLLAYSGNISADVFRGQVGVVLDVWERWMAVSQDVQDLLRDYLSGKRTPGQLEAEKSAETAKAEAEAETTRRKEEDAPMSGFKTSGFKSSFKPIVVAAPVKPEEEDLDGEAMDDLDGEAMDDLDGEAMGDGDLDGEVMDDLDGEAMDEDLDGEEM